MLEIHFVVLTLLMGSTINGLKYREELLLHGSGSLITKEGRANEFPCPYATDITPCECFIDVYEQIIVDCSLAESDDQMKGIFQKVWPVKNLHRFQILNNANLEIFDYDLNGINFEKIHFENLPNMINITRDFFLDSAETVTEVRLLENNLETFPFGDLSDFTYLHLLYIMDSNLFDIPSLNSNSLLELSLSGARITDIPEGKVKNNF